MTTKAKPENTPRSEFAIKTLNQGVVIKVLLGRPMEEDIYIYGIQEAVAKLNIVYPEHSISNILASLANSGAIERNPMLSPNPRGPARVTYRIIDRSQLERALALYVAEVTKTLAILTMP